MKIRSSTKLILILNVLWVVLLMLLGSWWMYLVVKFGQMDSFKLALGENHEKVVRMLLWEGAAFFALMFLLSGSLLLLYLRDLKKTHSLQVFFASLTHELKTPLASIKLQSEVVHEASEDLKNEKLVRLTKRLIEDTGVLESQMDKVLHLSRIERDGELHLENCNLSEKLKRLVKSANEKEALDITLYIPKDFSNNALIDDFAFEIVMKNLFENTKIHSPSPKATITLSKNLDQYIDVTYTDQGSFFGKKEHFAELFYKGDAKKGSGIGLYLSSKLIEKMKGKMTLENPSPFTVSLSLKAGEQNA